MIGNNIELINIKITQATEPVGSKVAKFIAKYHVPVVMIGIKRITDIFNQLYITDSTFSHEYIQAAQSFVAIGGKKQHIVIHIVKRGDLIVSSVHLVAHVDRALPFSFSIFNAHPNIIPTETSRSVRDKKQGIATCSNRRLLVVSVFQIDRRFQLNGSQPVTVFFLRLINFTKGAIFITSGKIKYLFISCITSCTFSKLSIVDLKIIIHRKIRPASGILDKPEIIRKIFAIPVVHNFSCSGTSSRREANCGIIFNNEGAVIVVLRVNRLGKVDQIILTEGIFQMLNCKITSLPLDQRLFIKLIDFLKIKLF